ncbi:PqqD family protein [Streptococcus merionis]|uniref:PqqD family protein n=1 Tax=Streptococcus merionis TaxID=400065 RepID=UPI00351723A5
MKLIDGVIVYQENDGDYIIVTSGDALKCFNGMIRCNQTAATIIKLLQKKTSENELFIEMSQEFDAEEATLKRDINEVLESLNNLGLLVKD